MGNSSSSSSKKKEKNQPPKVKASVDTLFADIKSSLPNTGGKERIKTGRKVTNEKLATAAKTGVLNLQEHGLKEVPEPLLQLSNLRTLDLSSNALKEVPSELGALDKLKSLKLDNNKLTEVLDVSALTALKTLSVSHNRLAGPASVRGLSSSLTSVNLSYNQLAEVPGVLLEGALLLPALKTLDLSSNGIAALPRMPNTPALEELIVDHNVITNIEASITALGGLKRLSLQGNKIAATAFGSPSICPELFTSSGVVALELAGNPLRKPELLEMEGINEFMERRREQKNKSLHGGATTEFSLCGLDR